VAFSPDGQHIASGSNDQTIIVRNAKTGETVAGPFHGHSAWVRSVAFSPDGQHIVSGSNDQTRIVWNAKCKVFTQQLSAQPVGPCKVFALQLSA
jgi:WD40 repeat protein